MSKYVLLTKIIFQCAFLIVFILLSLFQSLVFAEAVKHIQMSSDDEVGFELVEKYLNPENCVQEYKKFAGCLEANIIFYQGQKKHVVYAPSLKNLFLKLDPSIQFLNENSLSYELSHLVQEVSPQLIRDEKELKIKDYKNLFSDKSYLQNWIIEQRNIIKKMQAAKSELNKSKWALILTAYLENAEAPHSQVHDLLKSNQSVGSQEFYGVGVVLYNYNNIAYIRDVITGGPAEEAGITAGMSIYAIDDAKTDFLEREEINRRIRGAVNSKVKLSIKSQGKTFEKTLVRRKIDQPLIESRVVNLNSVKYGYIFLRNFFIGVDIQNQYDLKKAYNMFITNFENEVKKMQEEKVYGLVLDLRGNSGGAIELAVDIASLFLKRASLFSAMEESSKPGESLIRIFETRNQPIYQDRLAVLIDAKSASATEMFAGAMKFYERALIVGRPSAGKGSVQNIESVRLKDGFAKSQTVGLFFSPSGETNQNKGVEPHLMSFKNIKNSEYEQQHELREQDMFLFPLEVKQIDLTAKAQPPEHVLKVNESCFAKQNVESTYKSMEPKDINKDLQLLTAIAGLNCQSYRPRLLNSN